MTFGGLATRIGVVVVVAVVITSGLSGAPAQAISRAQVDEACTDSKEAYNSYRAARSDFEEGAHVLEEANLELSDTEYQEQRIRGIYQSRQNEQADLQTQVETRAVDLYMQSAGTSAGLAALSKPEDALVAYEFLLSSAEEDLRVVNDLAAVSAELDRLGAELDDAVVELTNTRDSQQTLTTKQEEAMTAALGSYDQLSARCKKIQAGYEAEQARIRAEEEARKRREAESRDRAGSGGSGGAGSGGGTVGGIICPFTPGRTQFSNSWGAPRSGGRSHKGTDMFAPRGEPIYAVASGTVVTGNYGLGGKIIWLTSTSGPAFYYAHLNGFAVGSGTRVSQGDLIAYNGNSGNAIGTSTHVHFQIHPGGRSGSAVNPYNTVAAVCF